MSAQRSVVVTLVAATAIACGPAAPTSTARGPGLAVTVRPLTPEGTIEAGYHVVVKTAAGVTAWEQDATVALDARGRGTLTIDGACAAADGPYTVELTLLWLRDGSGLVDPSRYVDPTAGGPLTVTLACPDAGLAEATFDIAVVGLRHGFEVGVALSDVFCSAKLDCVDVDGGPLDLLMNPRTGARGPTVVVAFACTTGTGEPTWLHMNDLYVKCDDGRRYWIDPSGGAPAPTTAADGQLGPEPPLFFQRAAYREREDLPGVDKCFWNVALGVDLAETHASCHIEASATASVGPLPEAHDPGTLALYPFIHWSVDITHDGAVVCGLNPLGGATGGTEVGYVELGAHPFTHSLECASTAVTTPPRVLCSGGVQPIDAPASVSSTVAGVVVAVGGDRSELYRLPAGLDAPDCCLSACCPAE